MFLPTHLHFLCKQLIDRKITIFLHTLSLHLPTLNQGEKRIFPWKGTPFCAKGTPFRAKGTPFRHKRGSFCVKADQMSSFKCWIMNNTLFWTYFLAFHAFLSHDLARHCHSISGFIYKTAQNSVGKCRESVCKIFIISLLFSYLQRKCRRVGKNGIFFWENHEKKT